MKRSELNVGDEIAYRRSKRWDTPRKAVVLAVEPYKDNPSLRRGEPHHIPCERGNGVYVEIHEGHGGKRKDVVQLAQLRGPWAEVKAAYDAERKADRDMDKAREAARKSADGAARDLVELAKGMGVEATAKRLHHTDITPVITLTLYEFKELLCRVHDKTA